MSCDKCPINCGQVCIAEKFGATNLCEHFNPASPKYNPAYRQIMIDKSCGSNNYNIKAVDLSITNSGISTDLKNNNEMPSSWQMLKNLATTSINYIKDGFKNVPDDIYKERMNICESCEFLDHKQRRCTKCGCNVDIKLRLAVAECPEKKWLKFSVNSILEHNQNPSCDKC